MVLLPAHHPENPLLPLFSFWKISQKTFSSVFLPYHRHHQGSRRGKNTIHIVEFEDMKIVHMGDIGCMMDDVSKLKNCDVLMIPIGGYYTIDTKEALKYIERIQPRIVIPMHYRSHEFGYDVLSTNEEFIQKSSNIVYVDDYLEVHKETKGQTIVFKKPRN